MSLGPPLGLEKQVTGHCNIWPSESIYLLLCNGSWNCVTGFWKSVEYFPFD